MLGTAERPMEPTGRDVGPFRSVTTVRVHGGFEICTGRDDRERAVTILTMGPSAATDERLRDALSEVYEWSRAHPEPTDGEFAGTDLTGDQPWVASLDEPGKAGVRRLLDRLARVMQPPTPGHQTGTIPKITDEMLAAGGPVRDRTPGPAAPPHSTRPARPTPPPRPTGPAQPGPPPQPAPAGPRRTEQTGPVPMAPAQPTHQTGPLPRPQAQTHQTGQLPRPTPQAAQTHQTGQLPRPAQPAHPHQTGALPRPVPPAQTHQTGPLPRPGPYQTGQFPRVRADGRVQPAPPPPPLAPYQGPVYSAAPRPIAPNSAMPARRRPGSRTATVVLIVLIVAVAVVIGCSLTGYLLFLR
jgi:hypothetical protein